MARSAFSAVVFILAHQESYALEGMEATTAMATTTAQVITTTTTEALDPLSGITETAQGTALVMTLLALTLILNNFVEKFRVPIPEAICTVIIGMVGGALVHVFPQVTQHTLTRFEDFSAREFMLIFIAPLIFAEGYGLKSYAFFTNISRILVHAFIGTVVSAVVVGAFLFYLPPLTGCVDADQLSFPESLTFGVLISATDPVTTLAIFKEMGLVEQGLGHLYYSVLGESILNDAVALTLFDGLASIVEVNGEMNGAAVLTLIGKFCKAWFGSLALGIAFALAAALLLKFARLGAHDDDEDHHHFNVAELATVIVLAYIPFLVAESIEGLSPIVAVMFAGITMRHYCHYNLTMTTRQVFLPFIELLASLCERYAFLLLGIGIFVLHNHYNASLIAWAVVGCLLGRIANVYPLSFIVNKCSRSIPVNAKEMHVMWMAGLRGVISFICALRFPENETHKHREVMITTTMVVVLASMVCLGWPTATVLGCLKLKPPQLAELDEEGQTVGPAQEPQSRMQALLSGPRVDSVSKKLQTILMTKDAVEERNSYNMQVRESRVSGATHPRDSGGLGRYSVAMRPSAAVPQRPSDAVGGVVVDVPVTRESAATQGRRSAATDGRVSTASLMRSRRTICDP